MFKSLSCGLVFNTPSLTLANSTKSLSFKSSMPLKNKEQVIFNLSAPGAAKLLNPFELSVNVESSSAFIVSSKTLNPILPVGVFEYWFNNIVSVLTFTNVPLIKYTPSDMEKDDPVDVEFEVMVDANASPLGMNVLFSGPEIMSMSAANNSPSAKVPPSLLDACDEWYFIYMIYYY